MECANRGGVSLCSFVCPFYVQIGPPLFKSVWLKTARQLVTSSGALLYDTSWWRRDAARTYWALPEPELHVLIRLSIGSPSRILRCSEAPCAVIQNNSSESQSWARNDTWFQPGDGYEGSTWPAGCCYGNTIWRGCQRCFWTCNATKIYDSQPAERLLPLKRVWWVRKGLKKSENVFCNINFMDLLK